MRLNQVIATVGVLTTTAFSLPVQESRNGKESTNWYTDSAAGVSDSLVRREESTNWYADSAKGVANSLEAEKRDEDTDWYTDSAKGIVQSLEEKREEETNWYTDSAKGVATSLPDERRDEQTNWYTDSAKGVVESLQNEKRDDSTDWYADSAKGVVQSLPEEKRSDDNTNWYADSAKGMVDTIAKRAGLTTSEKESYEKALRDWIYYDMRGKALRESSERGKAFFEFTPKPRHDQVDRWHVPAELRERFDAAEYDAERVSILNYYLMVTDREPKSAEELGFTPTADKPGLVETNEVGYGYALAGQHQEHCVNFVADAIDIGKDKMNDFFLKHTIHCLGLLKYLSPQLTQKQPLSFLLRPANNRLLHGFPQTIEEEE